jgi:AcrR family transcriptional regulator
MVALSEYARNPEPAPDGRYAPAVPRRQRLRREESQAQTREALLVAAGRLFDGKGFSATSIADIAEEAGYTTGALYSNFANKEDLFLAVLERQTNLEMAALRDALSGAGTMRGRLEVVGSWYASHEGQGRRRTRALAEVAMLARGGDAVHARLREQHRFVHEAVVALLHQQESELGIAFRMPIPALATAVLALLEGFSLSSAIGEEVDRSALIAALQLLLRTARNAT